MDPLVLAHVKKTYRLDKVEVPALNDINLRIRPNRFTVLSGMSGSGKTTLLNLIGCIDQPDEGEIVVAGQSVARMSDDALADFRLRHIGFIFQSFNLLPVLTAYENVEYPLLLTRTAATARRKRVQELLEAVGLTQHALHWPGQLSGGQRQRVAIARALAMAPQLVLADEPTANLDSHTGAGIIALMRTIQREYATTFVFSSHDPKVLLEADDAVLLQDGRIVSIEQRGESLQ
jgi:putative ABC transport system ATP-binding protein